MKQSKGSRKLKVLIKQIEERRKSNRVDLIREKNIKKLTWKYFLEQKWKEISAVLFVLFVTLGIVGTILQVGWLDKCIINHNSTEISKDICSGVPYEPNFPKWIMISGIIIDICWAIFGLIYWLRINWKLASERAKEELNTKKNKK
jgi:hypothetical protein